MDIRPRIYLDHAASTPMRPAAIQAMLEVMEQPQLMANPSSNHASGKDAARFLKRMRGYLAQKFACKPESVVFNSGGSEGGSHALLGVAAMLGRQIHLGISAVEHEAVQVAASQLANAGHVVTTLPVGENGVVKLAHFEELCSSDELDLVSVMAVNNETGVVQPIAKIALIARKHNVLVHCDAVRAVGHGFDELLQNQDVSLLNCTAHKFGGPRGVGALITRGIKLPQLICGGGQEHGARAGTENLAGIAGMVAALDEATTPESNGIEQQRVEFESELCKRFDNAVIHAMSAPRATHITSVCFEGFSAKKLQAALDEQGVCVGTGSACHDDGVESLSPVLSAMKVPAPLIRGTLRISMGWDTKPADWQRLLDVLNSLLSSENAQSLRQE